MWRTTPRASRLAALTLAALAAFVLPHSGVGAPARSTKLPLRLEKGTLGQIFFSRRFARAEVVLAATGGPQSVRIDKGRVRSTAGGALTLVEADGTVVTVPIASGAAIKVNGRAGRYGQVRRGWWALTARSGGAPAEAVEVARRAGPAVPAPGPSLPFRIDRPTLGNVFFAQRFARAELVLAASGGPQPVRIDAGRIRSTGGGALTLVERDGTVVTIPVSPSAAIRVGARPASYADLRRGQLALTARVAEAPAEAVEVFRRR